MNHALALVLCLLSFGMLALAMERHQIDFYGRVLAVSTTRRMRTTGWLGLGLALSVLVQAQGWGMALVSFSGHTSLAAGLVCLAMIMHARWAARNSPGKPCRTGAASHLAIRDMDKRQHPMTGSSQSN